MCTICGGCARAASGATQRDSHELLNLTLVTVSEGAGVMPQGSYLAAPSECRPRRFPSRGDGRADFVGSKNKCRRHGGLRTHMCRRGSVVQECFYSSSVLGSLLLSWSTSLPDTSSIKGPQSQVAWTRCHEVSLSVMSAVQAFL